jgi:Ala-tRNA(Pro) deacylase
MALTIDQLLERLTALGIATTTVRHPPVYTVEEAKAHRGTLPGAHIKNLFLKDKRGALWLIVAAEDRPVDLKALRSRIGAAALSFGSPAALREALGVEPGSVTPFAVINDAAGRVTVILDETLLTAPWINAHPLTNTATTAITPRDLLRFLEATGHPPRALALPERPAP